MTEVGAPDRLAGITIRRATPSDSLSTYDVVREAVDDLARSRGMAAGLGATSARVRIPGAARGAIELLLARGWRYGDTVTVVLTSAPWGRWDRYVTSGADALL